METLYPAVNKEGVNIGDPLRSRLEVGYQPKYQVISGISLKIEPKELLKTDTWPDTLFEYSN